MIDVKLRMTGDQLKAIKAHLFPGDGREAVAVALCGRHNGHAEHYLLVRTIVLIPYDQCRVREKDRVTWSTDSIEPLLKEVAKRNMAILKVHSHPGGYDCFSALDDISDRDLFSSVYGWTDSDFPHASAVMLPGGRMFGRAILPTGAFVPLSAISIAGDDLIFWFSKCVTSDLPEFTRRHTQLFGTETTRRLQRLSIAVVGCSGTGSPMIEQLTRLGVGKLILVDPDRVEEKNLNRILNATKKDADSQVLKVEVMARSIEQMGLGTNVILIPENLSSPRAVKAVAECDVVFGCMDGVEGRHLLNRLAAFYLLPYFDVGVGLEGDNSGGITEVCGAIHYLQPDRSSLLSRNVYTLKDVEAASLKRTNPDIYKEHLKLNYIKGVREDRPAVISVNMQIASMAVNEFLARLHPYRHDDNRDSAIVRVSLIHPGVYREREGPACPVISRHAGRGDIRPLLDMPELSEPVEA